MGTGSTAARGSSVLYEDAAVAIVQEREVASAVGAEQGQLRLLRAVDDGQRAAGQTRGFGEAPLRRAVEAAHEAEAGGAAGTEVEQVDLVTRSEAADRAGKAREVVERQIPAGAGKPHCLTGRHRPGHEGGAAGNGQTARHAGASIDREISAP